MKIKTRWYHYKPYDYFIFFDFNKNILKNAKRLKCTYADLHNFLLWAGKKELITMAKNGREFKISLTEKGQKVKNILIDIKKKFGHYEDDLKLFEK